MSLITIYNDPNNLIFIVMITHRLLNDLNATVDLDVLLNSCVVWTEQACEQAPDTCDHIHDEEVLCYCPFGASGLISLTLSPT